MKKLIVILTLCATSFAVMAQSLNLSSAFEAQNRGYLTKAKDYIDAAAVHEQTVNEPKTWYYRTLIYCKIGGAINDKTKEGKKLATTAAGWYTQAYNSVFTWKKLDQQGEYTNNIQPFFSYIASKYYSLAVSAAIEERKYELAMTYCDSCITLANLSGDVKTANSAYSLAGQCARSLKNDEATKRYYLPLSRSRDLNSKDAKAVYETLYQIYYKENDTINAMKIARQYQRNCPNDFRADVLLATAYVRNHNTDKGIEIMNKAVAKVKDSSAVMRADVLCDLASIYELANDFANAEASYSKSIEANANQFRANFGLGSMHYNRAVDKLQAMDEVPFDDETDLRDRLSEEAKTLFRQSIPNLTAAISFIDNLPTETAREAQKANLVMCLQALRTVYARLDMLDELKPISDRLKAIQASANQ